jgi:DNA-3-methyladenine glycosylase
VTDRVLPHEFYARDPKVVAKQLLNKVLVHGDCAARLVEVEAYCGSIDPGSHAFRGKTPRNATMFGPAGGLYVYFTYGMHWCANAVCGGLDEGVAVLLRAAEPLRGLDTMRARRGPVAVRDRDLCSGPAKLCQALGLDRAFDGADLVTGDRGVVVVDDGVRPPRRPGNSVRIGLRAGAEHPWRWYVDGNEHVSRSPARGVRSRGTRSRTA